MFFMQSLGRSDLDKDKAVVAAGKERVRVVSLLVASQCTEFNMRMREHANVKRDLETMKGFLKESVVMNQEEKQIRQDKLDPVNARLRVELIENMISKLRSSDEVTLSDLLCLVVEYQERIGREEREVIAEHYDNFRMLPHFYSTCDSESYFVVELCSKVLQAPIRVHSSGLKVQEFRAHADDEAAKLFWEEKGVNVVIIPHEGELWFAHGYSCADGPLHCIVAGGGGAFLHPSCRAAHVSRRPEQVTKRNLDTSDSLVKEKSMRVWLDWFWSILLFFRRTPFKRGLFRACVTEARYPLPYHNRSNRSAAVFLPFLQPFITIVVAAVIHFDCHGIFLLGMSFFQLAPLGQSFHDWYIASIMMAVCGLMVIVSLRVVSTRIPINSKIGYRNMEFWHFLAVTILVLYLSVLWSLDRGALISVLVIASFLYLNSVLDWQLIPEAFLAQLMFFRTTVFRSVLVVFAVLFLLIPGAVIEEHVAEFLEMSQYQHFFGLEKFAPALVSSTITLSLIGAMYHFFVSFVESVRGGFLISSDLCTFDEMAFSLLKIPKYNHYVVLRFDKDKLEVFRNQVETPESLKWSLCKVVTLDLLRSKVPDFDITKEGRVRLRERIREHERKREASFESESPPPKSNKAEVLTPSTPSTPVRNKKLAAGSSSFKPLSRAE
jgi:hypothetical protein